MSRFVHLMATASGVLHMTVCLLALPWLIQRGAEAEEDTK